MKNVRPERGVRILSFSAPKSVQRPDYEDSYAFVTPPEADTLLPYEWVMRNKLIIMRDYLPARLVKGKDRWYIVYYQTNPASGKRERHRETFELGRLQVKDRLKAAKQIIASINSKLPHGYPYDQEFYYRQVRMSIAEAFQIVTQAGSDLRHASILSYAYSMRKFMTFLEKIHLQHESIEAITRKVAMAYSDYLMTHVSGRSHNNDINEMKRVFNILRTRELVDSNPFEGVPKRKEDKKKRKGIDKAVAQLILNHLRQVDVSVYLSCALLYYCFIRPNEQRYLKSVNIDLEGQLIIIEGKYAKNRKDSTVTIPQELHEILINLNVHKLPPHLYIIGTSNKLGKRTPIAKSGISNRYRNIIQELHRKRILLDITGNTLYSWKDTGATSLARSGINAVELRDQLRHHSMEEMQQYIESSKGSNVFIRENHRL